MWERSHRIPLNFLWETLNSIVLWAKFLFLIESHWISYKKPWIVFCYELKFYFMFILLILWDLLKVRFPITFVINFNISLILGISLDFKHSIPYLINYVFVLWILVNYLIHWILVTHPLFSPIFFKLWRQVKKFVLVPLT